MPKKTALADLARSGLTEKDARRMGVKAYSKSAAAKLGLSEQAMGYVIPYFDLDGRKTDFFRYRLLEDTASAFQRLIGKKGPKYLQPPGSPPRAYFPPFVGWRDLIEDVAHPLIITEGEKKAAKATLDGFPTIGLGGVWSFRSKKKRLDFIPDLDVFVWEGRPVYIVYDSDAAANADVRRAGMALAQRLIERGARTHLGFLPAPTGEKIGLDDFLVEKGASAFEAFLASLEEVATSIALHELNEQVVYVQDPGIVVELKSGQKMQPQAFVTHHYADKSHTVTRPGPKNTVVEVKVQTAKEWLKWPHRAKVKKLVYEPGQPKFVDGCLNTWPGYAAEPKPGDVGPWHDLLDFLFEGEPDARRWFEQWCAFPIQHPGQKALTAVLLWGPAKGTGKSLVGAVLGRMYGKNYRYITDTELTNTNFNEWAENAQFILADEITANSNRRIANHLKVLITRTEVTINKKYLPTFVLKDCAHYLFTSNDPDALYIDENERRYFIHHVKAKVPKPSSFYRSIDEWSKTPEGQGALLHYLMTLPLDGFDPIAPAPKTEAMQSMVALTRTELETFLLDVVEEPDVVLEKFGGGDLIASGELAMVFDLQGDGRKTSPILVARKLKAMGYDPVGRVRMPDGTRANIYALRNQEKWKAANAVQIRKAFQKARGIKE